MSTLNSLFDWVLAASLRASILIVAVLAAQYLFKHRLPSRWRYAMWLPVLATLLVPALPLLPSWMNWPAAQSPAASPIIPPGTIVPRAAEPTEAPERSRFAHGGTIPSGEKTTAKAGAATAAPEPAPVNWRAWILAAWLLGAAGLSLFVVTSLVFSLRRIRRQALTVDAGLRGQIARTAEAVGLRRLPRVLRSSAVASPAVCGLWRPTLLLNAHFPQDLSADEADMVLRHELTHIRRGDLATNGLLCSLLALHWFNPLLWLAFFRVRADREAACDADVLEGEPAARRAAYAHTLLKMEATFPPTGLCLGFVGMLQHGGTLRERIHAIIAPPKLNRRRQIIIALSIGLLTIAGIAKAAEDKPHKAGDVHVPAARLAKAKKVSAAEFKKQYAWVGRAQTMHHVSYLGQQDGKACLSEKSRSPLIGKWSETFIFTPLEDLGAEFRTSLPAHAGKDEAGKNSGHLPHPHMTVAPVPSARSRKHLPIRKAYPRDDDFFESGTRISANYLSGLIPPRNRNES